MKAVILLCALLGVSIGDDVSPLKTFQQGNGQFSGKFLNEAVRANEGKNVIVSAYSVLFPLAQLSLATVGDSRSEILTTIGLPTDESVTKNAVKAAVTSLEDIKGVELKTASKIYFYEKGELNPQMAKDSKDYFKSDIEKVDFSKSKAAASNINQWVESKTNNRIKDLVNPDSLDSNTRVVLVNAIYFKGLWEEPFLKTATKDKDFHVTKAKTQKVPMMYSRSDYLYGESSKLDAKLLQLPYKGKETSLLVILPNEIDGVNDLVKKLEDPKVLDEAVESMHFNKVIVNLPKFKIETTTDLKNVLQKMGIKKIFGSGAEITKLLKGNEPLQVDSAIQKAFIEVNEEGTEAAAANAFIVIRKKVAIRFPFKEFIADHPFIFMIRGKSDALFTGIIRE